MRKIAQRIQSLIANLPSRDRYALDGTSPGAADIVSRPARLARRRNCRAIPEVRVLTSVTRAWTPAHVVPSRVRTIGRDERGPVPKTGRSVSASPQDAHRQHGRTLVPDRKSVV